MREYNSATRLIDELATQDMVQLFIEEDKRIIPAVEACRPAIAAAVEAAAEAMRAGGRMVYIGSGTAGKIGIMDASECPPTFGVDDNMVVGIISGGVAGVLGWQEATEDDEALAVQDLQSRGFSAKDVLVCISASGNTPYVLSAVRYARQLGAKTVGICCRAGGQLAAVVDIAITADAGPEVIMGSTRLKAGTAQKMILNILSSCSMIKLGNTYGNLMVNVMPLNQKLRRRVIDVIRLATGCEEEDARQALTAAGDSAKVAILMLLTGWDAAQARRSLETHGGYVKKAIKG